MTLEALSHATIEKLIGAAPARVLERLPRMGRVMVIARADGATHERIGPVETVDREAGRIRLTGACHDASIDIGPVTQIETDRSSVMKDKIYPRLTLRDAAGQVIVAIVGLEGLASFDAALEGFACAALPVPEAASVASRETPPDIAAEDPAMQLLEDLRASGADVTIAVEGASLRQAWQGRIEAVKPAMGFVNVMTPAFHLHLKGGSVVAWQSEPRLRRALGPDGQPTGLVICSAAFA